MRRSIADPLGAGLLLLPLPRRGTPTEELVRVAGSRWAIESAFEQAKQEVGLDDYEGALLGRLGARHVTLALLAHAFLEATPVGRGGRRAPKSGGSPPGDPH